MIPLFSSAENGKVMRPWGESEDLPLLRNNAFGIKAKSIQSPFWVVDFLLISILLIGSEKKLNAELKLFKMKKKLLFLATLGWSLLANAQFTAADIIFYVGNGPDTAFCVIDFQDATADSTYAWGYLFDTNNTVKAEDMLNDINGAEPNIDIAMSGGFLNDIVFNGHTGIGGSPNYWGTWSKTSSSSWSSNTGIGEVLANGDWFGCSYTDFSPAVEPGNPIAAYSSAKFKLSDIRFWIGTGSDTAVFVADFVTPNYGEQVSYAWGYLFDGTTDGQTMLDDIAAADVNLTIVTGSGFLNDIYFNDQIGEAGSPHYWGTFSGTNLSDWTLNSGLGTTINPGDWFGCSYDAWEPRRPYYPSPAQDSTAFISTDLNWYYGTGSDTAVIVIDFNEASSGESFAFGYLFNAGITTAEDALVDLNTASDLLDIAIAGGFLNDITYQSYAGIGGAPFYWSTWSSLNNGGWKLNSGLTEVLSNGSWFGCTYSSWSPATFPSTPISESPVSGFEENEQAILAYPNPVNDNLWVETVNTDRVILYDLQGKVMLDQIVVDAKTTLNLNRLPAGIYQLHLISDNNSRSKKIVKQ